MLQTIIVALIVATAVVLAVRRVVRLARHKDCGCGCGCSDCPASCHKSTHTEA